MQMTLLSFSEIENRKSIIELMNELNAFSNFSGLKPDMKKCEIALPLWQEMCYS